MSFCGFSSGEHYRDHFEKGIYVCSNCGNQLFHSSSKYEHSTPWPAFNNVITPNSLTKYEESPNALKISCAECGLGLGHEFLGGGPEEGQSRF